MKRILDIGAGTCCILCPSEIGARAVIFAGVPSPSISGMTPANVSTSQFDEDTGSFAELRLDSARCERGTLTVCLGSCCPIVTGWRNSRQRAGNRSCKYAYVLVIEKYVVPELSEGMHKAATPVPLGLKGRRAPEIHTENEVTDAER